MNPIKHRDDLNDVKASRRRLEIALIVLGAALMMALLLVVRKERTVVLEPPSRAKAIAVIGDRVDAAWLEEMGSWVAWSLLSASPKSIDWQQAQVLRWTHPATHGALEERMTVAAKRLVDANASTVFWPLQVAADADRQRVLVLGTLETFVNAAKVGGDRRVAYMAQFENQGGRMLLREWQEVPLDDPWLVQAEDKARKAQEKQDAERKKRDSARNAG
jgi:conjugal transfer pilus assembly protein TraE